MANLPFGLPRIQLWWWWKEIYLSYRPMGPTDLSLRLFGALVHVVVPAPGLN